MALRIASGRAHVVRANAHLCFRLAGRLAYMSAAIRSASATTRNADAVQELGVSYFATEVAGGAH
jgi:hypothetical protein